MKDFTIHMILNYVTDETFSVGVHPQFQETDVPSDPKAGSLVNMLLVLLRLLAEKPEEWYSMIKMYGNAEHKEAATEIVAGMITADDIAKFYKLITVEGKDAIQ